MVYINLPYTISDYCARYFWNKRAHQTDVEFGTTEKNTFLFRQRNRGLKWCKVI